MTRISLPVEALTSATAPCGPPPSEPLAPALTATQAPPSASTMDAGMLGSAGLSLISAPVTALKSTTVPALVLPAQTCRPAIVTVPGPLNRYRGPAMTRTSAPVVLTSVTDRPFGTQ